MANSSPSLGVHDQALQEERVANQRHRNLQKANRARAAQRTAEARAARHECKRRLRELRCDLTAADRAYTEAYRAAQKARTAEEIDAAYDIVDRWQARIRGLQTTVRRMEAEIQEARDDALPCPGCGAWKGQPCSPNCEEHR